MFKPDTYVYRTVGKGDDAERYVYRIVKVPGGKSGTKYVVQVPYFAVWGSTFARWSVPKEISRTYLENRCKQLPTDIARRYAIIKKGESTAPLFKALSCL